MDPRFKHPFTCIVAGPSQSGKTEWVKQLIIKMENMIVPPPSKVVWHYGIWQDGYKDIQTKVDFVPGLDGLGDTFENAPLLVVIDDLMDEMDKRVLDMFTKKSHHQNTSIILIVQNLFADKKFFRTVSLNAHYLVVFENARDRQQITALARQLEPKRSRAVVEAFEDAVKDPHGYLLIDCAPGTPRNIRYRTDIFSSEPTVYVIKNT